MCDARDLGVVVGEKEELGIPDSNLEIPNQPEERRETRTPERAVFEPNIYLYDRYPGGVGFSEPLFRMSESLVENTYKLIAGCACVSGCPSCVGPAGEVGEKGKEVALAILRQLRGDRDK
jgi:DEAD/DEAH box helicase domain-containing protein